MTAIPHLLKSGSAAQVRVAFSRCRSAGYVSGRRLLVAAASVLAILGLLFLAGCTVPIGANQTSVRMVYKHASANALSGDISVRSQLILQRYDLAEKFDDDPAEALKQLHEKARTDNRRDLLYALAELTYLYADQLDRSPKAWEPKKARDYFLAASIYAYLYILGPAREAAPTSFERGFRTVCDLYNAGLARGLGSDARTNAVVLLEGGVRRLPPGQVDLLLDTNSFPFELSRFQKFLSADQFLVRGLSVRIRQAGLGAPLIGLGKAVQGSPISRRVPVTAFLRVEGDVNAWSEGRLKSSLELYSGYEDGEVVVDGKTLPLETDLTAPLAHSLNETFVWQLGMGQFFSSIEQIKSDVYLTQPYQKGRIPVVFVHGTFSSPVWWSEMMNTLRADPQIRERCQFWFFIYNSGNPVPYSALKLREALTAKIKQLDPDSKDPALQQMVIIGHSQGGLLTKLTATNTKDVLWQAMGIKSLDDPKLSEKQREVIRRYTIYEALPFVTRVIFISTPHRGSYLAGGFIRNLTRRLVTLPSHLLEQTKELTGIKEKLDLKGMRGVPTSLDSMSTESPYLLALAEIPTAPGVKSHSIIAVQGKGDYKIGKDGLVAYSSAHVDYAESEFIVRSFHSCQDRPPTIEEVRRILLLHLQGVPKPAS
jgi:pimeloyl-ACP methyl ester carboxylesterase